MLHKSLLLICLIGPGAILTGNNDVHSEHAIYISVIELHHQSNSALAQIKVKVFTDDFENALTHFSKKTNQLVSLSDDIAIASRKDLIEAYINKKISGTINTNRLSLKIDHWEINQDAIWFNFNMPCPKVWNTLKIKADLLMELFPTQSNIIQILNGNEKKYFRLTIDKVEKTVTFSR